MTPNLPIYITCHSFHSAVSPGKNTYKVDDSKVDAHPYQLFRLEGAGWKNLSVYASIGDALRVLLKELFSCELTDEINHGQATINPSEILERINMGERTVSIGGAESERYRIEFDVSFEDLIERT